jgi:hypothetical protein
VRDTALGACTAALDSLPLAVVLSYPFDCGDRSWKERCEISTLTCPNPWLPSISRSFSEVACKASRVNALWLANQTCA